MKRKDMELLPELEISKIATKKNTKGVATKDAKLALCNRTEPVL